MVGRRFGIALGAVTLFALALRVAYVVVVAPDELGADATWYLLQAGTLGDGVGYVDPGLFYGEGVVEPTANFPPLWPLLLSVLTRLGIDSQTGMQLAGAVVGTATVPLTGLVGRRVAGPLAGTVAAGIVACSPLLIAADGSLMADSLHVTLVTAALLVAYRALDDPGFGWFAALGGLLGLAALARSDALILAPVVIATVAWRARSVLPVRRLTFAIASVAVAVLTLAPWTIRNATTFDEPLLVSSNSGSLLEGANCPTTYGRELLGAWDFDCLTETRRPGVPEVEWSAAARRAGISYATDHPGRLPIVGVARVLRGWGLWEPTSNAELEAVETRRHNWQVAGWAYGLATLMVAVPGMVVLVRRRADVAPLLAVIGGVTLVLALSWGNPRFRLAAEPAVAVLAAAAIVRVVQPASEPKMPTNDTISPG